MAETFEIEERGCFWWADEIVDAAYFASPNAVVGLLRIGSGGRIELELDGNLPSPAGTWSAIAAEDDLSDKAIKGLLKDTSRRVLLADLHRNGGRASTNGLSFENFSAGNCLIGNSPLSNYAPLRRMIIDLAGFEEWISHGNMQITEEDGASIVSHNTMKNHKGRYTKGALGIRFDVDRPIPRKWLSQITFKETCEVEFRFQSDVKVEYLIRQHQSFQDLMVVLTNSENPISWPSVAGRRGEGEARLYFRRVERRRADISASKCWTFLPWILPQFTSIALAWNERHINLGPAIYMYSGTRRGMDTYVENKFMNLVIGLEAMHRATSDDVVNQSLKDKIERILACIERPKDKNWLRGRLRYAVEPTLAERLVQLITKLPIDVEPTRLTEFANKCSDARNDIAHFGGARETGDSDADGLTDRVAKLNLGLDVIYHLILLREVGISGELLRSILYNKPASTNIRAYLFHAGILSVDPHLPMQEEQERR